MRYAEFVIKLVLLEGFTGHTKSQDFVDYMPVWSGRETERFNWKSNPLNTVHFASKY